jgi:hypothetical protein
MATLGVLGAAEDPVRDAQLERQDTVHGEDDHAVRAELRITTVRKVTAVPTVPTVTTVSAHGPILTNAVLRANGKGKAQAASSVS